MAVSRRWFYKNTTYENIDSLLVTGFLILLLKCLYSNWILLLQYSYAIYKFKTIPMDSSITIIVNLLFSRFQMSFPINRWQQDNTVCDAYSLKTRLHVRTLMHEKQTCWNDQETCCLRRRLILINNQFLGVLNNLLGYRIFHAL